MTIGTICAKEIGVCAKPECLCLQALHGNLATYLRLRGENVFLRKQPLEGVCRTGAGEISIAGFGLGVANMRSRQIEALANMPSMGAHYSQCQVGAANQKQFR